MHLLSIFLYAIAFQLLSTVVAVTTFNFKAQPERIIYAEDNRIRGFRDYEDKDFIIGGLFAVHSPASGSAGGRCGTSLIRSGPERIEAFLYTLDLINNDPNLLPNIILGYDIRDTCVSENVALDEIADLIFTQGLVDCDVCFAADFNESYSLPVSAIIGATTSQVSISVASLLRLFTTPQVSYSASSPILNNRDRYGYFYRTIPSDDLQAQAMIDLVSEFGWNFVSVIHSNNAYGEPGIDVFRQLATGAEICIDLDLGIDDDFTSNKYYELASTLINESSPNVVVFFASLQHVEKFFEQFKIIQDSSENQRNFLWIASDSWAQAANITDNYAKYITGLWGFLPDTNNESNYNDYFSQLTLSSNKRNPWFTEYYEDYYNCSINSSCLGNVSVAMHANYTQRPYIQLVIDAIYSVSHALNNFLLDNCELPVRYDRISQTCEGQKNELNGLILRDYLQNVSFISPSGNHIAFDSCGNIEGRYEITNFQVPSNCIDCTDQYEFVNTGNWDGRRQGSDRLQIFNVLQQFGVDEAGQPLSSLQSQCQRCESGNIMLSIPSSCCGTCSPCLGRNYTNTTTSSQCSICPDNMWGNNPLNGSDFCEDISESYLDPSDPWGIVLIIVAIIGLIAVVLVSITIGFFWNTPIIKSSGREQMVLLLIGITLCFLIVPFFIIKPSLIICLFQRAGTWLCFSLILCALFVKLVRIARVFLRDQNSGRPKFVEPIYQIIFTLVLVGFQMVLVIISLAVVYPDSTTKLVLNSDNTNDVPTLVVTCASPHIALISLQMIYYTILLIASNALAMLTIQFPANFNEVRYVAFSTFFIGIIWIAFVVIFFAIQGNREVQTAIISFAIQMSALAVLICMFGSRIFIMIVWPSRNVVSGGMNTQDEQTMVPFSTQTTVRGTPRSRKSLKFLDNKDDPNLKNFINDGLERKQSGNIIQVDEVKDGTNL